MKNTRMVTNYNEYIKYSVTESMDTDLIEKIKKTKQGFMKKHEKHRNRAKSIFNKYTLDNKKIKDNDVYYTLFLKKGEDDDEYIPVKIKVKFVLGEDDNGKQTIDKTIFLSYDKSEQVEIGGYIKPYLNLDENNIQKTFDGRNVVSDENNIEDLVDSIKKDEKYIDTIWVDETTHSNEEDLGGFTSTSSGEVKINNNIGNGEDEDNEENEDNGEDEENVSIS